MNDIKVTELVVFVTLFLAVTVMGFVASRWQPGRTLQHLDEWGLGGRKFGSWVTWFLIGGDIYTAYTFVAVPALMFSAGAAGFFAIPYTIIMFPLVMMPLLRLWSVSRVHGYVTPADFVRGRYDSPTLALIVAFTGIVATMPYIALQLVGLEAVLRSMGFNQAGLLGHLPLFVAFVILALYTYQSGLRAPALIAFVKDVLIYLVIFVAVLYLPIKLGGWSGIFNAAETRFAQTPNPNDGLLLNPGNQLQYATLALGSALALFLYPHSITGVLASRSRTVIKRNMSALPLYSLLLGMVALLGYSAIAAGVRPLQNAGTGRTDTNTIIPLLFDQQFPDWFAGLAFAAIGIGALVPAAIMSIAAANLWTRNVFKEYLRPDATPAQEARQAKMASLVVKFGAVVFIVGVDPQYSIDLQLIGGVIILQTLPAVAISLYTRWLHRQALVVGWFAGMACGMWMLYGIPNPASGRAHFGGSAYPLADLSFLGMWHPFDGSTRTIYVGLVALLVNLAVTAVLSLVLRQLRTFNGSDATTPEDYFTDDGDARIRQAMLASRR
ncbi:MAG TPA: sodium:solute symporter [Pseudonocardiaceae bacterium]